MSILNQIKKGPVQRPPKIMLIGVEGVGKSTAGANMPNPLFICGESGLVGPQFKDVPNFTPESWKDVLDLCDELAQNPGKYRSLVIDTLDWLEPMLYAHVVTTAHKSDIKHIEDFGYGKGYVMAQTEARQLLSRLDRVNAAGMNILILSHSQLKTVQNPTGENYDHFESKVNQKIAGVFKEWCDCILFAHFEVYVEKNKMGINKATGGDERIVQTTHSAAWDAKNRYGLPEEMPLDMKAIMSAIMGKDPTADLVKEIETLLPKMDAEKASKTAEWLKGSHTTAELKKVLENAKKTIKEADNG